MSVMNLRCQGGGAAVTLPSAFLDARGNPVYGQEAQNRELVRQLIGGYYGALTSDNDIIGGYAG